jgi:hypothetical protein
MVPLSLLPHQSQNTAKGRTSFTVPRMIAARSGCAAGVEISALKQFRPARLPGGEGGEMKRGHRSSDAGKSR